MDFVHDCRIALLIPNQFCNEIALTLFFLYYPITLLPYYPVSLIVSSYRHFHQSAMLLLSSVVRGSHAQVEILQATDDIM